MRAATLAFWGFSFIAVVVGQLTAPHSSAPKEGYVPNAGTAVKIAEAVLVPVYGDKQIESEKPFTAIRRGDEWIVSGTLHCRDQNGRETTNCVGGTAVVESPKIDARIISMIHYK